MLDQWSEGMEGDVTSGVGDGRRCDQWSEGMEGGVTSGVRGWKEV